MKKSFQNLTDGYLKKLTKKETLTAKWQKKLIFPLADMIKAAIKEASSHPKIVAKFRKSMKKENEAHMKRVAHRKAKKDAKLKLSMEFEAKKQAANTKMDTFTKIRTVKKTKAKAMIK
jgi:uncharacterized protein YeaO (DUF488 family)